MAHIIDTGSNLPKYVQIGNWIREMIRKGRYKPEENLPSETRLADMCAVNRNTVRQALSELVREGLLCRKSGVGTFVAPMGYKAISYPLDHISSTMEVLRYAGYRPSTRVVSKEIIRAAGELSEKLMVSPDSKIIRITRLRLGDFTPFILEKSHLPHDEFKAILDMDLSGSLYMIMTRDFGIKLHRSTQSFQAVLLRGIEAEMLGVPEGSAGMFLESLIYDDKNVAVELLQAYYRGDKYVFQVRSGSYQVNLCNEESTYSAYPGE